MANPNTSIALNIDVLALPKPILDIFFACSNSHIQPLALVALADLGSSILADAEMVQKAKASFERPWKILIGRLKLRIGLQVDPVSKAMQEHSQFVASFLLAVGCKTIFTVDETALLLYQLIGRNYTQPYTQSISVNQLADVLTHISGYGDLIPNTKRADEIWTDLSRHFTSTNSPPEIDRKHSMEVLAEIVTKTFEAYRDDDNRIIIIRGCYCALFVATIFLWLCPKRTICVRNGDQVYPYHDVEVRLVVEFKELASPWTWEIEIQREELSLSSLLARFAYNESPSESSYNTYYPLKEGFNHISRTLGDRKCQAVGFLANAFVQVLFEDGELVPGSMSRQLSASEQTRRTIQDMCPENAFGKRYAQAMQQFGWNLEERTKDSYQDLANLVRKAIKSADLDPQRLVPDPMDGRPSDPVGGKPYIISVFLRWRQDFQTLLQVPRIDDVEEVVEFAADLAMQALLLFTFSGNTSNFLKYTPVSSMTVRRILPMMTRLLIRFNNSAAPGTEGPFGAGDPYQIDEDMTFTEFRLACMSAMLPGDPFHLLPQSLAASHNGYVAYSAILETLADPNGRNSVAHRNAATRERGVRLPSTFIDDEREAAWTIHVMPGQMTWDERAQTITNVVDSAFRVPGGEQLPDPQSPINPYDRNGNFMGFGSRSPSNHAEILVAHMIGISTELGLRGPGDNAHQLMMTPYITSANALVPPSETSLGDYHQLPPNSNRHLSWIESIQAWAFANYVEEKYMTPKGEQKNADNWRLKGYFNGRWMQWCPLDRDCPDTRVIVSTGGANRELRFFEAGQAMLGRRQVRRLFIRCGRASLLHCLLDCTSWEDVDSVYSSILM